MSYNKIGSSIIALTCGKHHHLEMNEITLEHTPVIRAVHSSRGRLLPNTRQCTQYPVKTNVVRPNTDDFAYLRLNAYPENESG